MAAQREWILIREIVVQRVDVPTASRPSTRIPKEQPPKEQTPKEQKESSSYPLNAVAVFIGFFAGSVAWLLVRCSPRESRNTKNLGELSCWALYYILVLDLLVFFLLWPSSGPAGAYGRQPPQPHSDFVSNKLCASGQPHQQHLPLDWQSLSSGILNVDASKIMHLGSAADPRFSKHSEQAPKAPKAFLSVGLILDPETEPATAANDLAHLLSATGNAALVGILVPPSEKARQARRGELILGIRAMLGGLSPEMQALIHLLDPSLDLYPHPPARRYNVDLALLISFLRPLADTFMLLETSSVMAPGYPQLLQQHSLRLASQILRLF